MTSLHRVLFVKVLDFWLLKKNWSLTAFLGMFSFLAKFKKADQWRMLAEVMEVFETSTPMVLLIFFYYQNWQTRGQVPASCKSLKVKSKKGKGNFATGKGTCCTGQVQASRSGSGFCIHSVIQTPQNDSPKIYNYFMSLSLKWLRTGFSLEAWGHHH